MVLRFICCLLFCAALARAAWAQDTAPPEAAAPADNAPQEPPPSDAPIDTPPPAAPPDEAAEIDLPGFEYSDQIPYDLPERNIGSYPLVRLNTRRGQTINIVTDRTSCVGSDQSRRTQLCLARTCIILRELNTKSAACCGVKLPPRGAQDSPDWHCGG